MKLFTAKEIAEALNISKRNVSLRAKNEDWPFQLLAGLGGRVPHYLIEGLPVDVANAVETKFHPSSLAAKAKNKKTVESTVNEVEKSITSDARKSGLLDASYQDENAKRASTSLFILKLAQSFAAEMSSKVSAWNTFIGLYNNRELEINEAHYRIKPSLSYRTLLRWEKSYTKHGFQGLVTGYGKTKGKSIIETTPEMKRYSVALIHQFPHIKGQRLSELLKMEFEGKYSTPSPSTCRDWLRKWKDENKTTFLSLMDASGWQNKHMAAFGSRSAGVERINQLWEFDSTPADVMLTDGRYSIIGVIDVFTRRVKVVLKPTSNAEGIALLIRNTILDWGIPEVARTDNGADYCSAHIFAIWDALGIHNQITNPYSGWEKPFIERFFRTFSHGIAEMLSGYIGHNVSDREKKNARLTFAQRLIERREKGADRVALDVSISSTDFEKFINSWLNYHYDHTEHSELKCTPFEKFTQHQQTIKRLDNERLLDVLLAPVPSQKGFRTVGKEGISVEGVEYIHAELGAYIGERVHCRFNPDDIGKIYVFDPIKREFICEAFNPELVDNEITMTHAQEAKRIQRARLRNEREAIKQASKEFDVSDVAQKFLAYRESQTQGLKSFPKPSKQVSSGIINSISQAEPKKEGYSAERKDELAQRRDELNAIETIRNSGEPIYQNEHHKARHYTQLNIDGRLGPTEKAWLHQYRRDNRRSAQMLDKLFTSESKGNKR